MLDHEPSWTSDPHYQKTDRIFLASDPEGHELLGVSRMQSLYSYWKKSGNVGKLKTAGGKNAANVDAMLRQKEETKGQRKPRSSSKTAAVPSQASTTTGTGEGEKTRLHGVNWVPNSIKGGSKQVVKITPEHIANTQEAGRFLLWSRLTGMYPSSFSFGSIKSVSTDIVQYVTDLNIEIVDTVQGFIQDVAEKRILICKVHEALSFIAVQLLMAAKENEDEELELFVIDVLEPAVIYLKDRFSAEMVEKREKFGDPIANDVVGREVEPEGQFEYQDDIDPEWVSPDQQEGYSVEPEVTEKEID